jgi:hypothetical protein
MPKRKPIPFSFGVDFEVLSIQQRDYKRVEKGQVYLFNNRTHPLFTQERPATVVDKEVQRTGHVANRSYYVKVKWATLRE